MSEDRLVAGRYRLAGQLGRGGMGVVWKAHDERLDRTVAVKQLLLPAGLTEQETDEIKRLAMREGRIAAKLQHPNLIMVYDVVEDGGQPYLIMEYHPSRTLSEMLAERGTVSPAEAAGIGAQAAAALAAAHAAGVVHRDVKPGNILLGEDGSVKITDFGISRAVEDVTTTSTGIISGTPAYLSPEVAKGQRATFSSDVFSLGSTLYTAIEGTPPFGTADNSMALLYRVASQPVTPPRQAGPMADVLARLLRPEPERRPTMAEAGAALTETHRVAAGNGRPVGTATTAALTAPAPTPTRTFPVTQAAARPAPPPPRLPPVVPVRRPGPSRPGGSGGRGGRKGRALPAVLVGVLMLALGAVLLGLWLNRGDGRSAGSATSTQNPTGEQTPGATSVPVQPAPTGGETDSNGDDDDGDDGDGGQTPSQDPPGATPSRLITDYYGVMPGDTEAGWSRLTDRYRQNPGGGYQGYQRFWGQMRAVEVSDVTGTGDSTVEATVVYSFKAGKVVEERHRYTLVQQDGRWLIDDSDVLSSRTR